MRSVLSGAPVYLTYFGFTAAPFSTTPDQRFLYLGERHREGVVHLLYGLTERGGFVQLTGEVGTGKTTLCRYILDHAPEHVDIALVLNPTVTRFELLATICDELRVPYPAGTTSIKELVDALHRYLLSAHAAGRRTVVIVDEAQHLSAEVLEQMRLLTNLETATAKLLQIILVGQPELTALLERNDLRQVAQRVAARFHLTPLGERETGEYVRHRLAMAGQRDPLFDAHGHRPIGEGSPRAVIFDDRALRAVHRASHGVPRVINIVSDRALLGAYALRSDRVTAAIVRRAAREVAGETGTPRQRRRLAAAAVAAVLGVAAAAASIAFTPAAWWSAGASSTAAVLASPLRGWLAREPRAPASPPAKADASTGSVTVAVVSARDARTEPSAVAAGPPALTTGLDESLTDVDTAYRAVVAQWGKQYERRPYERPCDAVRRVGLECIVRRGTWNVVRRFDLPAVLEIGAARGGLHFLAVTRLSATHATIDTGMRRVTVALDDVERDWDGSFVVVWKPLRPAAVTLAPGARGSDVVWLREQLAVIDAHPVPADASARIYDEALGVRVTEFQRTQGLTADGIAGVETLARLTALVDRATPSLREPAGGS